MNALVSDPIAPETESLVIQQLNALAHASRLNIFRELTRVFDRDGAQGLAAGELAKRMQLPAPTLSFHIKELSQAGLVSSEKIGRSIIYRVNGKNIRSLLDFLLEDCCTESGSGECC